MGAAERRGRDGAATRSAARSSGTAPGRAAVRGESPVPADGTVTQPVRGVSPRLDRELRRMALLHRRELVRRRRRSSLRPARPLPT